LDDFALELDDFGWGVPEAFGIEGTGAEESEVEFPEGEGVAGHVAEQDGLALEELAAEEVDTEGIDAGEDFGHREAVGDDGEGADGLVAEDFGNAEDGGSGIEEDAVAGAEEAAGGAGHGFLAGGVYGLALLEGRELEVEVHQGTAEGAGDFLFAGEGGKVAAGGGFGNAKLAAKLTHGHIAALLDEGSEATATFYDQFQRHTHGSGVARFMIENNHKVEGSVRVRRGVGVASEG
jgi:hypothetical protein